MFVRSYAVIVRVRDVFLEKKIADILGGVNHTNPCVRPPGIRYYPFFTSRGLSDDYINSSVPPLLTPRRKEEREAGEN